MGINIETINEDGVLDLADLIKNKQDLIRARKGAMDVLNSIPNPSLSLLVAHKGRTKSLIFDSNQYLERALSKESEWIIDRVYDTAIHNLEKEILVLSEKVMKNLINSHKPY